MKTNLPQSRNRNLPAHPEGPADGPPLQRRPLPPPPFKEPRSGPSVLRQVLVMLIIGGLFAGGVYFYIRQAESDAVIGDTIESDLLAAGRAVWAEGHSPRLFADTPETQLDLDDLPRVVRAVKEKVKDAVPTITVAEKDPPLMVGTHQIVYRVRGNIVFAVRIQFEKGKPPGTYRFLGEINDIKASRKDMEKLLPPVPVDPSLPPPVDPAAIPPVPAVPAAPGEKVSEQP